MKVEASNSLTVKHILIDTMHKSNLCTYSLGNTEKLLLSVALSLLHANYLHKKHYSSFAHAALSSC